MTGQCRRSASRPTATQFHAGRGNTLHCARLCTFNVDIDLPESVAASGSLLEVHSEETLGQGALDSIEESSLLLWLDSVDAAEREAHETVAVGVLCEGSRDGGCCLDGLCRRRYATNINLVGVDVTGCAGLITIGDVPGSALQLSARCARIVQAVAGRLLAWSLSGEDPAT